MSQEGVKQVIGRLLSDDTFKQKFLVNPGEALEGADLTPEELVALAKIDLTAFSKQEIGVSRRLDDQAVRVHSLVVC